MVNAGSQPSSTAETWAICSSVTAMGPGAYHDSKSYQKYFSMRRENSKWSEKNKALVQSLEERGLMTGFGREKVEEAKRNGQWYWTRIPANCPPSAMSSWINWWMKFWLSGSSGLAVLISSDMDFSPPLSMGLFYTRNPVLARGGHPLAGL